MKKVLLIFMALIFAVGCGLCLLAMVVTKDPVCIIPGLPFFAGMVLFIILLCKKKRVYHIYDDYIVIEQKGKSEQQIRKNDVRSLRFKYTFYHDDPCSGDFPSNGLRRKNFCCSDLVAVTFKVQKKRYHIKVDESNHSEIIRFFNGIESKESTNWVYYLLELLSGW